MPDSAQDRKHGLGRLSLRKWNWRKEKFPFSLQNSSAESFVSAKKTAVLIKQFHFLRKNRKRHKPIAVHQLNGKAGVSHILQVGYSPPAA